MVSSRKGTSPMLSAPMNQPRTALRTTKVPRRNLNRTAMSLSRVGVGATEADMADGEIRPGLPIRSEEGA